MKRIKPHRKPSEPKRISSIAKVNKGLVKRTRKHIQIEDANRKWEDEIMSTNLIEK
jgi:hypothetical protein